MEMEMKEYLEKARKLGQQHGKNAAGWVFYGDTSLETYARFLAGIQEGDPQVMDSVREPSFSGEYSDEYSETDLAEDLGFDRETEDEWDDVVYVYLDAAREAFWHEIERVCHVHVHPEDGDNE